ncbi:MAG: hypothetical protein ACMV0K_12420 [Sulfurospirillum sp.]
MQRQGISLPTTFEEGVKALDMALDQELPKPLQEAKKNTFYDSFKC